ncbi:Ribosome maturation factor RimP [bioreactor metagenome]|uniref:Ribosome maturation factor RimP n=1 Tax=bioreactor metagenome TaxID=1076179 RepID=A0A645H3L4_9ZZZZ
MTRGAGALECSFFVSFLYLRQMIEKSEIIATTEEFLKNSPDYLVDIIVAADNTITVEIDNDNGVNIDDCVKLSRYIESKLDRDAEDFELTVTSAGLTSPFKTRRQYKKYEGEEVEVLTRKGEKLKGRLKSSTDNNFTIEVSKMVKPEGAKRKTEVKEEQTYNYDEIKYTKYQIRF